MIDRFFGEYRFLSNFYPSKVVFDNIKWPTVEHAYQWAKIDWEVMDSIESREDQQIERIAKFVSYTPGQAKRASRALPLRPDWEVVKDGIMRSLLEQKFKSGSELAEKLIETHPQELIEGNTWGDVYWGVCNGKGLNKLGEILMSIRNELVFF